MKIIVNIMIIFFIINLSVINFNKRANCSEVYERKRVYLTFDDGPSFNNTDKILDILQRNDVKATFCVVGSNVLKNKGTINRLNAMGMGIIPHCNNHEYRKIYSSTKDYADDLQECINTINKTIKEEKEYTMVRMPGGSTNHICSDDVMNNIKCYLRNRDMFYLDWSVDSGDAHGITVDKKIIEENIVNSSGKYNVEVVLMHDTENKTTTRDALQEIIDTYKKKGYEFKTVDEMEKWEIEYLIKTNVINR